MSAAVLDTDPPALRVVTVPETTFEVASSVPARFAEDHARASMRARYDLTDKETEALTLTWRYDRRLSLAKRHLLIVGPMSVLRAEPPADLGTQADYALAGDA
jgi:hypothetical protein